MRIRAFSSEVGPGSRKENASNKRLEPRAKGRPIVGQMRIGTRKSAMALAQTEEIARRLALVAPDIAIEIVKFETTGDADQTSKLLPHGGKGGAFVRQIREAVLAGERD